MAKFIRKMAAFSVGLFVAHRAPFFPEKKGGVYVLVI